jgi:type VI secretion system protein ImpB
MAESAQHKLDRIRPPRVQITYDLETGGAIQKKEIPFVMGIMADLSGDKAATDSDRKRLSDPDRKFIEIDRDNFDSIMRSIAPTLEVNVESEGRSSTLDLTFECMDDFMPLYWDGNKRVYSGIVTKHAELNDLFEARLKLNNLLAKLDMKIDSATTVGDVLLSGVLSLDEFQNELNDFAGKDPLLAVENANKAADAANSAAAAANAAANSAKLNTNGGK